MAAYQPRHPGYWCKSTLYHRGWSLESIIRLLGEPDIHDAQFVGASYYEISRVLKAEKRRAEAMQEYDRIMAWLAERKLSRRAPGTVR